jgi:O-antigen/teichoic acid export membrane protein
MGLRVIRLLLNLFVSAVVFRYLGPEQFGLMFTALAMVMPLLCLAELGLARVTVRELVRHPDHATELLGNTIMARGSVGALCFSLLLVYSFSLEAEKQRMLLIYGLLLFPHFVTEFYAAMEARGQVARVAVFSFPQWCRWYSLWWVCCWKRRWNGSHSPTC